MSDATPAEPHSHKRRDFWLILAASFFILVGILWFLFWVFIGRFYVVTEDAYVAGNQVMLTPQVSSGVKAIFADDADLVEQGQLVVELDNTDYILAFNTMKNSLANTVRDVAALFQDVGAKKAEVALRKAEFFQAELDLFHREGLANTGAISTEEFEQYETNVKVAAAALYLAERQLEAAQALVEGTTIRTHPQVIKAVMTLKESYLNLIRCQVKAPVSGYIAKRSVQAGDWVETGDTLLMIVPLNDLWLNASYKETKLRHVRTGQSVTFTSDIYGRDQKFHGKVLGFQPGSGSAFSILPPENASGNWIKIIQRVPVRISIDPEDLKQFPLLIGLSLRTVVDVRDTNLSMFPQDPTFEPIYYTPIYTDQIREMEAIAPLIEEIIIQNGTVVPS